MTFQVYEHARMLGDGVRLKCFDAAITSCVRPDDVVLDAGTGTGILALLAARQTEADVFGVEFFEDTAAVAERAFIASERPNLRVLKGNVKNVELPLAPQVAISETIGALGPEEGIVEIFYDLKRRWPNLRELVPSKLSLFVEAIETSAAEEMSVRVAGAFERAARFAGERADALTTDVLRQLGRQVFSGDISDARQVGERTLVKEYELGLDRDSSFASELEVLRGNAVHVWFEAELCDDVKISSHRNHSLTHWGHSYVIREPGMTKLKINYNSGESSLGFVWE